MKSKSWHISLVACSILTLELALIRLIPAEVRVISYFTNLVLMATFFGLGLGCILHVRFNLSWTIPTGLFLITVFVFFARGLVIYDEASSVHFWLQYRHAARPIPIIVAALTTFTVSAFPFIGLGQLLILTMDKYPRLVAYGWDIFGSLLGTALFSIGSYFMVPPWIWPIFSMLLLAIFLKKTWLERLSYTFTGTLFAVFLWSPLASTWSPYYLIQHIDDKIGTQVFVNSSFHQLALDFNTADPSLKKRVDLMDKKFGRPYNTYQQLNGGTSPRKTLILGAGTGNDVCVALRQNIEEIVAVEIDPVILDLGRSKNTCNPYRNSNVRVVIDDARHFLRTSP